MLKISRAVRDTKGWVTSYDATPMTLEHIKAIVYELENAKHKDVIFGKTRLVVEILGYSKNIFYTITDLD